MAWLFGIGWLLLGACFDVSNDLASDEDGDGFTEFSGDCDDQDAAVHPLPQEGVRGLC